LKELLGYYSTPSTFYGAISKAPIHHRYRVKRRLFVAGFLKTGNSNSTQGNYGLMDIIAGLHWLRENLSSFGGDPDRITVMGHSTGAALANFIAASPVTRGKQRAN
jgi:carboxylesterase type B